MADFSLINPNEPNIPFATSSVDKNPLGLTNPNAILTGTSAGMQMVGSPSLTVDSIKNLITVKPISTVGTQILRYGQVSAGYLGMAVNDGTNDTMFAGRDSSGNTVVKIAKSGFDAKTATNDQLIFNSGQDVFKVVISGTRNVTPGGIINGLTTYTVTIPHGLTNTPAFLAYVTWPVGLSYAGGYGLTNLPSTIYAATGQATLIAQAAVDATNLYLQLTNPASNNVDYTGYTWPFKYYLLQETAN